MNHDQMNKGIQDLKNISLTNIEKENILKQVMKTPVVSPYIQKTIWSFFKTHRSFAYVLGSVLTFVVLGGGLAYAAEGSVPGDLLYPVKIRVTEPIRDALAITPAEKASWDAEKAVRRLNEAETLANKNKLTPQYQNELEQNFNKNVNDFNNSIRTIATTTPKRNDIAASFHDSLQKQADILAVIGSRENDSEQKAVNQLQQKVLETQAHMPVAGMPKPAENASTTPPFHLNENHFMPRFTGENVTSTTPGIRPTSTPENNDYFHFPNGFERDN